MSRRPKIPGTRRRALLVLPTIPDDLDAATKSGIAVRNAASVAGVCPSCGCVAEVHRDPELVGVAHAVFLHEATCPALVDGEAA